MKARLLRATEFVLSIFGGLLVCLYGALKLDQHVQARVALERIAANHASSIESSNSRESKPPGDYEQTRDFSVWSAERIVAFERAIGRASDEPIAVLRVKSVSLAAPVFQSISQFNLNRGVGWIPGTSRPGESGNIGIAGHRDNFFRRLKDIVPGDQIELATVDATFVYRVTNMQIVNPEDTWVLARSQDSSLTLLTCYPFYFVGNAPRRFVVKAHLVVRLQTARNREAEKQIEP